MVTEGKCKIKESVDLCDLLQAISGVYENDSCEYSIIDIQDCLNLLDDRSIVYEFKKYTEEGWDNGFKVYLDVYIGQYFTEEEFERIFDIIE